MKPILIILSLLLFSSRLALGQGSIQILEDSGISKPKGCNLYDSSRYQYQIEIKGFVSRDSAKLLRSALEKKGNLTVRVHYDEPYWIIRIPGFSTKEAAEKLAKSIQKKHRYLKSYKLSIIAPKPAQSKKIEEEDLDILFFN